MTRPLDSNGERATIVARMVPFVSVSTDDVIQPLLNGLFGLGGVIAGAYIATKSEIALDTKRLLRETKREEQARSTRVRTAARLVDQELRDAILLLKETIYFGQWIGGRSFNADVFHKYRDTLATAMNDEEWTSLSEGFQQLNELNWRRIRFERGDNDDDWSADVSASAGRIRPVALTVIQARRALLQYSTPSDINELCKGDDQQLLLEMFPTTDEDYEAWRREREPGQLNGESQSESN